MNSGEDSPDEISEAFTVAPEVVYSPIVLAVKLATKISDPDTAIPNGFVSADTSVPEPTGVPAVVYSPIVLVYVTSN